MQDIGAPEGLTGGLARRYRRGGARNSRRPRSGNRPGPRHRASSFARLGLAFAVLGRYATICVAARRRPELHPSFALTAGTPWAI